MKGPGKKNIEDIFALTPMQEGMLFHYLKDSDSDAYFEQLTLSISGEIDVKTFEKAWNFVVEANEMLRAVFRWEKVENPIQAILKKHHLQPRYYDFSGTGPKEVKKRLEEVKLKDRREKFDLREVPFRLTLCKTGENKYELMISNHHILYDGWSTGIILREFLSTYNDLADGQRLEIPVKTKFKEFVKWFRNQDRNKQQKYWKQYLQDFDIPTGFPGKIKEGKKINDTGNYHLKIADDTTNKLESFLKAQKISLSTLLYSAWGILLHKYNYCEDIIFDITVSGRSIKIKGIEDIVGLFIDTVPLRIKTHPKQKIKELVSDTHRMLREREEFEPASLVNIEEYPQSDNMVLFNSVLVIENYPLDVLFRPTGNHELALTSFSINEMTRYDVTVIIAAFNDTAPGFTYTYDKDLFDEESIKKVSRLFCTYYRGTGRLPG